MIQHAINTEAVHVPTAPQRLRLYEDQRLTRIARGEIDPDELDRRQIHGYQIIERLRAYWRTR